MTPGQQQQQQQAEALQAAFGVLSVELLSGRQQQLLACTQRIKQKSGDKDLLILLKCRVCALAVSLWDAC
jgi:hypothetical protein